MNITKKKYKERFEELSEQFIKQIKEESFINECKAEI